ncbi:MAG: MaoC/PaaZ C-terminal domain-containing protein [Candidatus Methylomirabilia bacterium]
MLQDGMRGKYWDDLKVGQVFWSSGRTMTEHDLMEFAGLAGDFNPLHVDAQYAKDSVFGERIPHGPLGLVFALGGYDRIGLLEGVAVAFVSLSWRFLAPFRIGDTVRTKVTIKELKETNRPDRGMATLLVQLVNQSDIVVQEGEHIFMMLRRAEG